MLRVASVEAARLIEYVPTALVFPMFLISRTALAVLPVFSFRVLAGVNLMLRSTVAAVISIARFVAAVNAAVPCEVSVTFASSRYFPVAISLVKLNGTRTLRVLPGFRVRLLSVSVVSFASSVLGMGSVEA